MEFEKRKARALDAMKAPGPDKSPKGTVDAPIVSLLDAVNSHPCFFTTSSCSGRISIFCHPPKAQPAIPKGTSPEGVAEVEEEQCSSRSSREDSEELTGTKEKAVKEEHKKKKKRKAGGGSWLLVSHDPVEPEAVVDLLFGSGFPSSCPTGASLVLRFEPFILAVECRDASSAQSLVSAAISSGFRESGITNLHRRIIVAIRSSIRLEVPLGSSDDIMVSPEYVLYLIETANEKMQENRKRTDAFHQALTRESALSSFFSAGKSNRGYNGKVYGKVSSTSQVKQIEQWQNDDESGSFLRKNFLSDDINCASSESSSKNISGETETVDHMEDKGSVAEPQFSLSAQPMVITGEQIEKLFLWGHSASALNVDHQDQIIVFGGFGGPGRHARRNDALMLNPHSGFLRSIDAEGPLSPRLGHTSSTVGNHVFFIGGRGDPTQIFNEVWVLDVMDNRWMLKSCSGSIFPGRHRHAAAVLGSDIYVFGGLNDEVIYSTMYVLDSETMGWREIGSEGEHPCARHSHALVANDSMLFMFGGYDGQKALGDFYIFNVAESCWKSLKAYGKSPSPRFSHSMFIYGSYIGIIGGCPIREHHEVSLLHLEHYIWRYVIVDYVARGLLVRNSMIILGDDLILLGGGASCYAFGAKFNQPMRINLLSLLSLSKSNYGAIGQGSNYLNEKFDSFASFWDSPSLLNTKELQNVGEAGSAFLKLEKLCAKRSKDILKKFGWLDLLRKVVSRQDDHHILLPISLKFFEDTAKITERFKNFPDVCQSPESIMLRGPPISDSSVSEALDVLLSCGASIVSDSGACSKRTHNSFQKSLKDAVFSLVKSRDLPPELMAEVPKRWDRLGDMVVIPVTSFKDPVWDFIGQDLWPVVANSLGARRLARQGRVLPTGTRDSTLEVLVGENGFVRHTENGIIYSFDAEKCMFSFGNLSEKIRMGQLDCRDEVVVDLFAGIGYFVLPFLVRAKARLVYACEWNPHALAALRHNLEINKVEDRCIVIEGDNRMTAPKDVADRVCLGLLPSSEESWLTAVRALRPEGGVLHIHGNADEEKAWAAHVVRTVDSMAKSEGRSWDVSLGHVERVKWYAPRVRHLVADVLCRPDRA